VTHISFFIKKLATQSISMTLAGKRRLLLTGGNTMYTLTKIWVNGRFAMPLFFATLAFVSMTEKTALAVHPTHNHYAHAVQAHYRVGKGSYYRKIASSRGDWQGISGVITLPTPAMDPMRFGKNGLPLDGFSIYMGGNARGQEVDAGLSWERCPIKGEMRYCWRPFVRVHRWNEEHTTVAWEPGDTVKMSVEKFRDGWLRLTVCDNDLHPKRLYQREFRAARFRADNERQFKRVDSIDQKGREGLSTLPTGATVLGAKWNNTFLLRKRGEAVLKVAISSADHTGIREGFANVRITSLSAQAANGGETIDLYGSTARVAMLPERK
jgi:hypothetical protein